MNLELVEQTNFGEVEVDLFKNENNEVFMTAKQLGESLGYSNPVVAINKIINRNDYLQNEEFSVHTKLVSTDGKSYNTRVLTEDGIYEITILSQKPKAREFRRFVRNLLKGLRKGNLKIVPSFEIEDPIKRAERWIEEEKRRRELEGEVLQLTGTIQEYEPKVKYVDTILESKDAVTVTQIAKDYGLSAVTLNKLLNKWKVQHKVGGQWVLYSQYAKEGYTKSKTHSYVRADGTTGSSMQTRWTQKGRLFIHNLLIENGYEAIMDKEE